MAAIPPGARVTSLAGMARRVTQSARYVITGVEPTTWFGPMQPLAPMAPQDQEGVKGRRYDYPTGVNLNYNPRSSEAISFAILRALADNCDLMRIAIESRKDQMSSLDWTIRPRQAGRGDPKLWAKQGADAHPDLPQETKDRVKAITEFMQYPDRELPWDQWLKAWMEDVFVIDAASIWRRRNRDGTLYALELIDGATIKPLLGPDGRRPLPPDPAYQQILHGIPAADFTTEELMYLPWNYRTHDMYGYSKVEQIIVTVNTAIRRTMFQLNYYTEGSQPDAFMGLPKEWSLEQIKSFQDWMDSLLSGNLATRRKLRFVPGEFKYQETKPPPLKDTFDEYLARVICFTFAIAPDPFIEHVSRGVVEKSNTRALEAGMEPNQSYVKMTIDRIIAEDFKSPDLEFKFVEVREQDPKTAMDIDTGYAKAGVLAIDDIRLHLGKEPLGGPFSLPMVLTKQGYIPITTFTSPEAAANLAASGDPTAQNVLGQQGQQGQQNQQGQSTTASRPAANANSTPSASAAASAAKGEGFDFTDAEFEEIFTKDVNTMASQGGSGPWPIEFEDLNGYSVPKKRRLEYVTDLADEESTLSATTGGSAVSSLMRFRC